MDKPDDDWQVTERLHTEQGKGDPFAAAMRATHMPVVITDPRRQDNPVVFANNAFLQLTGYSRDEVTGRNCRFLQGPKTSRAAIDKLRAAVAAEKDISIDLLNYRKDGSTFWSALYMSPVIAEAGELRYFFASHLDITDRVNAQQRVRRDKQLVEEEVLRRTGQLETALKAKTPLLHEVDHRVRNNLQMISSLLVLQANAMPEGQARQSLLRALSRVETLGATHRRFCETDDVERFDIGAFARDLAVDLVAADGRQDISLELDLDPVQIPAERAAPLALLINELVTNCLRHAFETSGGRILVAVKGKVERFQITVQDNGIGMDGALARSRPGLGDGAKPLGRDLVRVLSRQLRASITWADTKPGTRAQIVIPLDGGVAQ